MRRSSKSRRRIGVVFPGEAAEGAWSGIPWGLGAALRGAGVDAFHLDAEPRRLFRLPAARIAAIRDGVGVEAGSLGPEAALLRTVTALARGLGSGRADGLVQIGTTFEVLSREPKVTFEDATVLQMLRLGDAW